MLDVTIGVRVTNEEYEVLREIADKEDRTVASVARRMIRKELTAKAESA